MGRALDRLTIHGLFGHLYLHTIMMVLASVVTTSFAILLLFSLPSCLHLCATPFWAEGIGANTSSPYSSDTSPDTDSRSGYCTSTRVFHNMHAPSFSPSSYVPFVFRPLPCSSYPTCCPCPRSQPRADRCSSMWVRASRSCSWLFFVHVAEEDTMVPTT